MQRLRNTPPDVVAGAAGLLLALVLLGGAVAIAPPPSSTSVVGPSVFPYAVSILLGVASLFLLVRAFRQRAAGRAGTGATDGDAGTADGETGTTDGAETKVGQQLAAEDDGPTRIRRFLIIGGMLLGYILIFIPVGYVISTFMFLAASTIYMDPRKWIRNLIFAVLFAVIVYVSFTQTLHVQLPAGILG